MRIVFFSHYFPPEGNAPASRTYEHCVRWARKGYDMTVITCAPNVPDGVVYDGYSNRIWPQRETLDGINVFRVWTYVAPNAGAKKRILNYLSYLFSALFCFLFFCRRPNLIIATSPQFFCGWTGTIASWLKWCPFILEIRDIWPESIVTVGAMKKGLVIRILEVLEKWMYRSANHIVAVGNGYRDNILAKVNVADRISVVTNGVDPAQYVPQPKDQAFLEKLDLADRFVCSYVGTIGLAHGLDVVVRAAVILKAEGRQDIAFCLVGDGARRADLERMVIDENLTHWVKFAGLLPKSDMPRVLASSDCLLVHLKGTELFESVIPSKIFETMAMQRPLIMGVRGESADIVRRSESGIEMEPENAEDLVNAVKQLCDDDDFYQSRCRNGREFVSGNFSRDALADQFLRVIQTVSRRNL